MHQNREDLQNLLWKLCTVEGVAGQEDAVAELCQTLLSCYTNQINRSALGNVTAQLGQGERCLLIDAHLDQVGLIVTNLLERGFVRFTKCGGADRRVLIGKPVVIFGKERVHGIISSIPPHLAKEKDKALPQLEEMMIDTGYSEEELKRLVAPGDRILVDMEPVLLQNGRMAGPALDNRSSVAAVLRCLELLKGKTLPCKLVVQFSVQEETGGAGAKTGAFSVCPQEAIAVDVTFAQGDASPETVVAELGGGVQIGVSPVLSQKMSRRLEQLAQKNAIPYQLEVMGSNTGTNADSILEAGPALNVGLLSIPQRSMHTAVEIVSLDDIEATAQLLADYVLQGGLCHD